MFVLNKTIGIESKSVSASATGVTYNFEPFRNAPFAGLILADLQQPIPTGTATTLPVQFGNVQVLASNGANATVDDFGGAGSSSLVLLYYNSEISRLQLVGTFAAPATTA